MLVRQHCITIAIDDTAHSKGKELTPIVQYTWCTRNAPNLPGAHQRQGNKPEGKYQELLPGTPVWVQHKQNATLEPAIVVNQCAPNSCWIMQENGAEQPKVYRHTRSMLKIRSTQTDSEQKAQVREWSTETDNTKFNIPAIPYGNRNIMVKNSQGYSLPSGLMPPLPSLHWEMHLMHHLHQEHASQHMRTLESQPRSIVTNFTCKDTIAAWISGLPVENVEL